MSKIKLLFLTALVGILTALTYYVFEFAVHSSIDLVWNTLLNTGSHRWRVFPLTITLTLVFFGIRHLLDRSTDRTESRSLGGGTYDISVKGFVKVLFIGFFSLVAGASLGPEAILVPASAILGMYLSTKVLPDQEDMTDTMKGAGLAALFTAFFHSFIIGFLSLFLLNLRSDKTKINFQMIWVAIVASATSILTLSVISPSEHFFNWPAYSFTFRPVDLAIAVLLLLAGYLITWSIYYSHNTCVYIRSFKVKFFSI